MMKLPFNPSISADQSFSVLIPERLLMDVHLMWNTRSENWYISVKAGDKSIQGLKVVPRWPLLLEHRALSPIDGDIIVLPLSDSASLPITYKSLGRSWGLFWLSQEDVQKWEDANGLG